MKTALVAICLACCVPGMGQSAAQASPKKIAVYFSCQCSDSAGDAYATAFRDLLATSPRYSESPTATYKLSNGKDGYNWQIRAVSLDPTVSRTGESTVLSVVFLWGNLYFNNVIQVCNRSTISSCAEDTLSDFDGLLNTPPQ